MTITIKYPWAKDNSLRTLSMALRREGKKPKQVARYQKGRPEGGWFKAGESPLENTSIPLPAAQVKANWQEWNRARVRAHKKAKQVERASSPSESQKLTAELTALKNSEKSALDALEKSKRVATDSGIKTDSRGNWKNKEEFASDVLKTVGASVNDRGEIVMTTTPREMEFIKSQGEDVWNEFTKRAKQATEATTDELSDGFWDAIAFEKMAVEAGNETLLASAKRMQIEEFTLSAAASKHGLKASKMKPDDWGELGETLKEEAYDKLKFASETQRSYERQKLRGKKTDWMIVGKDHVLVHGGASRKDAAAQVKRDWERHKNDTERYTSNKLAEYGYPKKVVETLIPSQRRKLLAEIGLGEINGRASIKGISTTDRRKVIGKASLRQRLDAYDAALDPGKAEGLELWNNYVMATMRAGKEPQFPSDDVMTTAKPPGYVTGKTAPGSVPEMPEDLDNLMGFGFNSDDVAPF